MTRTIIQAVLSGCGIGFLAANTFHTNRRSTRVIVGIIVGFAVFFLFVAIASAQGTFSTPETIKASGARGVVMVVAACLQPSVGSASAITQAMVGVGVSKKVDIVGALLATGPSGFQQVNVYGGANVNWLHTRAFDFGTYQIIGTALNQRSDSTPVWGFASAIASHHFRWGTGYGGFSAFVSRDLSTRNAFVGLALPVSKWLSLWPEVGVPIGKPSIHYFGLAAVWTF